MGHRRDAAKDCRTQEVWAAIETFSHLNIIHRWFLRTILIASLLTTSCRALAVVTTPPLPAPSEISVFTVNPVSASHGIDSALDLPSQCWLRGWLKLGFAPEYGKDKSVVDGAHASGALFGGGVNCALIQPYENGLTFKQFQSMATCDPRGRLVRIGDGWFHGALANPDYLRYLLGSAEAQIDAGADVILLEGLNGDYSSQEGFDLHALGSFSQYLLDRYVSGQHWDVRDSRWTQKFRVDFTDPDQCPDGTMLTFNYAHYLVRNGWGLDPSNNRNPLASVWGTAQDIGADTFSAARNRTVWTFLSGQIRSYARQRRRRVWIAVEGLTRHADLQMLLCPMDASVGGGVDPLASHLGAWLSLVAAARGAGFTEDAPLVAFQDWRSGSVWDRFSDVQREAWTGSAVPEIFASGIFFAYPVPAIDSTKNTGGPGSEASPTDSGYAAAIYKQARFVRAMAPLLHGVTRQDLSIVGYTGNAMAVVQGQALQRRLIVHLINRDYVDLTPRPQVDRTMQIGLGVRPVSVVVHNASTGLSTPAEWTYTPTGDGGPSGTLALKIASLRTWNIVEIRLPRWAPLPGQ